MYLHVEKIKINNLRHKNKHVVIQIGSMTVLNGEYQNIGDRYRKVIGILYEPAHVGGAAHGVWRWRADSGV
jgi:hypothetical protein